MNMGWHTPQLRAETNLSLGTLTRLENGEEISRVIAAKYLQVFGWDLNQPWTLPDTWQVSDRGDKVVFSIKS